MCDIVTRGYDDHSSLTTFAILGILYCSSLAHHYIGWLLRLQMLLLGADIKHKVIHAFNSNLLCS
jgi:hypothetical protein